MKKSTMYNHINRNTVADTNRGIPRGNVIFPEIYMDQMWTNDDTCQSAVEVIELNSSNDQTEMSPVHEKNNLSHAWCYVNNTYFNDENEYTVNKSARERRRLKNEIDQFQIPTPESDYEDDTVKDYAQNSFHESINHNQDMPINHNVNCFTIIDKRFNINSDTSSEGDRYADMEIINGNSSPQQWNGQDKSYDGEIITYNPDQSTEKRTIWIYSFGNKYLLPDNEIEMLNIPSSTDSCSTYCSTENSKESTTDNNVFYRIATPIPPLYIPKRKLFPPELSTLTEVSESNKIIEESKQSSKEIITNQKRKNIWVSIPHDVNLESDQNKSRDVTDWLALSPRERRRKMKEIHPTIASRPQLPILREINSCTASLLENKEEKTEASVLLTQAQVHSIVAVVPYQPQTDFIAMSSRQNGMSPNNRQVTEETPKSADIHIEILSEIKGKSEFVESKMAKFMSMENINSNLSSKNLSAEDIGVHNQVTYLEKPQMKFKPKQRQKITQPIENLSTNNWILEDELRKKTDNTIKKSGEAIPTSGDNASSKLHERNLSLLKPKPWTEFVPIYNSIPSINLSIGTVIEDRKPEWIKYFVKCFQCCKKNNFS